MENNNKSEEVDIKNCMSYYYDNIIKIEDVGILTDEKSDENIFVHNILSKTLIDPKLLRISFD